MTRKYGCNPTPSEIKNKMLRMSDYIKTPEFLVHPASWDWGSIVKAPWGMDGNGPDTLNPNIAPCGDCVIACMAHETMIYTALEGKIYVPSSQEVVTAYSEITGYDPTKTDPSGDNPTDNGTSWDQALSWWQKKGFGGNTIGAYVAIDPTNVNHINAALYWFGPLSTAINVYQFMEDDFDAGKEWKIPEGWNINSSEGGHGIPLTGFASWGKTYNFVTWGQTTQMSGNCRYGVQVEVYAKIDNAFVTDQKPAPNGFSMDQLVADLALVIAADSKAKTSLQREQIDLT